jgi:hypothetical protein
MVASGSEGMPPGFEPTGHPVKQTTESAPPAAEPDRIETEISVSGEESQQTEDTGSAEFSESGPAPESSADQEFSPEPIATQGVPVTPDPGLAATEESMEPLPKPLLDGGNGNGAPEGVELQTPPEEGPFHGFVDTSIEAGARKGSGRGGRSGSRWFAIGGILIGGALIVFALAVWSSRGSTEPERESDLQIDSAGVPAPAKTIEGDTSVPADKIEDPAIEPTGPETGTGEKAGPPPESSDPAPGKTAQAGPAPTVTTTRQATPTKPAAPQTVPAPKSANPLLEARQALSSGQFTIAAEKFQSAVSETPQEYTLQLLLACKASTIAGLMPPPEDFLLLPQKYKGRDCFRVCWGRFPNRSTALAARQQVPRSLSGLSGDPFPLAFSSLTAAAGKTP